MNGYHEITTQEEMDRLLDSMAGFHDSMTKEVHLINRGSVEPDGGMFMTHRLDAQVLLQTQAPPPRAAELVFIGIQEIRMEPPGEYFSATGTVERDLSIRMSFDRSFEIRARRLFYRMRPDWLGSRAFLTSEVPSPDALKAILIGDGWRRCECGDAWQVDDKEPFSVCPACGSLTEL